MGLQGSPASFARLIDFVFRGLAGVNSYIDDVMCHAKTHEEQLRALEQVFLRLRKYNLKLNLGKSVFGAAEVNYLGYTLTGDGISPGKEKLKAIQDFPAPTNIKKIREFIGLANYFRFLIPNFSLYANHLTALFKKNSEYKEGPLPDKAAAAFEHLREALGNAPVVGCLLYTSPSPRDS